MITKKDQSDMSVNVEEDFAYDISIANFPWLEVIKNNVSIKNELKEEFSLLKPRPKLHWYFREFISDKEWAEECTSGKGSHSQGTQGIPATNFQFFSKTSELANKVIRDFNELTLEDKVEPKYYGRFIEDTETVKVLRVIDQHFDTFRDYIDDNNAEKKYAAFAKASAKGVIRLTKKLRITELKRILLEEFSNISAKNDFRFTVRQLGKTDKELRGAITKFNILKTYFTEIIEEEMGQIEEVETVKDHKTNTAPPSFTTYLMGEPDWSEILWQYNTGKQYQHKQDLTAVFWNSFVYIEQKFDAYFQKFKSIDYDTLENLVYRFRQKFSLKNRVEGVNYYDDLIEQMIEKYKKKSGMDYTKMGRNEKLNKILEFVVKNKKRHNIVLATVQIDIFEKQLPSEETRQLFKRVIESGKVKALQDRYIGWSIDTEDFLKSGGFGGIYKTDTDFNEQSIDNPQVFFSYSWANKVAAEKIYQDILLSGIKCKKDTVDIRYRDNIREFMESIRLSEYSIILISDNYLKSDNCMIEFSHLMKERGVEEKILPIMVADAKIFKSGDRLVYCRYWKEKYSELKSSLESIDPEDSVEEIKKLREIRDISQNINDYLNFLEKMLLLNGTELENAKYAPLVDIIMKHRNV